ncbi:MAG: trigger factor [Roseibacillus sp.]|nr:trigger factor [Roseibacillus sp.]
MKITVERQANCAAKLSVEIPPDQLKGERQKIIRAFSSQARIQGFRPGKIPRTVIEKRFGEQITAELEQRMMQNALNEATEKEGLRIIDAKPPEDTAHHPDGVLTFSSALTIAPEFGLPDYKGIVLEIPDRAITDEDIENELQNVLTRYADYSDITDRSVQAGDFAVIDYGSQLDGKPTEEAVGQSVGYLGGGEDYWLKMEDDSILPGFSKALEGAALNEERDFKCTVPEEFAIEELRGLEIDFHVTLKGIKEQKLPDLTDELAAEILPGSDVNGLTEAIRGNLEHQLNQQIEEFKVSQLLDKLTTMVQFDLPPELLNAETQGQADEMVERGLGSGMSEDEIEGRQDEIFAAATQRAQVNLKTDFLLQRIAEEEEIQLSQEELANRVASMANQAKKPIKAFAEELQKSGRLRGLQHSMLLSKTIDFLLEHAKVDDIEHAAGETVEHEDPDTGSEVEADPENPSSQESTPDVTEEESANEDE